MTTRKIKATFLLDAETVQALGRLASKLGISKSEADRLAVRLAAEQDSAERDRRIEALDALQASLGSEGIHLEAWAQEIDQTRLVGYRV